MFNLPRNKLRIVEDVTESLVLNERVPARILSLVRDLIAFRFRSKVTTMRRDNVVNNSKRQYMNVLHHNKGMDMLNLPRILNCKRIMMAVPNYLRNTPLQLLVTHTLKQLREKYLIIEKWLRN